VCLFTAAPTWFIIVLSLSIALASLIIVVAVVILACLRFCPACRRPSSSEQQQQQSSSRRSSLRIDMPPPYPGPFIPGQVVDLMAHHEPTAPDIWTTHTDNVSSTNEACGGVDVLDKKWPLDDDDDEGYFVPDAVEMNAKLEEAIPPPPHVHYDQRRQQHHHYHDRHRHHRQQHGEDNDCFVPDDAMPHRLTRAPSHDTSSFSSATPVSAAWRRRTSAETGATDSTAWPSLSSSIGSGSGSGGGAGGSSGGAFSGSSSSRLRSPAWFLVPSTASSSVSSQSPLVLDDDPDTTQTSVDYY